MTRAEYEGLFAAIRSYTGSTLDKQTMEQLVNDIRAKKPDGGDQHFYLPDDQYRLVIYCYGDGKVAISISKLINLDWIKIVSLPKITVNQI